MHRAFSNQICGMRLFGCMENTYSYLLTADRYPGSKFCFFNTNTKKSSQIMGLGILQVLMVDALRRANGD